VVAGIDHTGINASAFATALPGGTFVSNAFAADPTVATAFGAAGAVVLGTAAQGAFYPSDATGSHTYTSEADFTLNSTQLTGHLLVGLLGSLNLGSGFDSLDFSVIENNTTVKTEDFTSFAAANAFFDDTVLDLGSIPTSSSLDLKFDFELMVSGIGDGYGENFLFGAASNAPIPPPPSVPEPGTLSLFSLGAASLLALRHRGRRRASI
jgi:hypothetical protein